MAFCVTGKHEGAAYAPVRGAVVLAALAAILLLAVAVCALHWQNAVSLRGTIRLVDCETTDGAREGLTPLVEEARTRGGAIYLSGALLREGAVGEVRVRVALIRKGSDEATLLNTQMVRRYDLAQAFGCDDHCGFAAAVRVGSLSPEEYDIALIDESDGARRLVTTGRTLTVGKAGSARLGD